MDVHGYIDRLEEHFDNGAELNRIVADALGDRQLVPDDRDLVLERARTYLADAARADGPG